jgi:hypothetical protein
LIYTKTGNLRAVQLLLGHTNRVESTVRYLGIAVDAGLQLSEQVELQVTEAAGAVLPVPSHRLWQVL